ncbi:hypothetical protein GCM10007301_49440 [Azorhizobium oxalatiphilum]|uniref:Uncharacterized protein n=1 Tax=Azorhizobium oxalatiphilum TaxID=980631 RepID=A0A917CCT7_9HYPH|nr:hypothetical protein GCM10007301_49440 [Azorhizobium oxalatiphilum]
MAVGFGRCGAAQNVSPSRSDGQDRLTPEWSGQDAMASFTAATSCFSEKGLARKEKVSVAGKLRAKASSA